MAATPIPVDITPDEMYEKYLAVECLGRFAVDEYNKQQNALVLEFKKVLSATQPVRPGSKCYLILDVFHCVEKMKKVCEANVWLKSDYSKELLEFKILDKR